MHLAYTDCLTGGWPPKLAVKAFRVRWREGTERSWLYRHGCDGTGADSPIAVHASPTGLAWQPDATPHSCCANPLSHSPFRQVPAANGAAYAMKLLGKRRCSITYFGEGCASEGDIPSALNIASVHGCPTIFFCRNNGCAFTGSQRAHFYPLRACLAL